MFEEYLCRNFNKREITIGDVYERLTTPITSAVSTYRQLLPVFFMITFKIHLSIVAFSLLLMLTEAFGTEFSIWYYIFVIVILIVALVAYAILIFMLYELHLKIRYRFMAVK